jgi:dipeptide transport system permease protein
MFFYFIRRFGLLIPTFFGVTIASFVFIRLLPGDPVLLMAGERGLSPERHAELMERFGFDRPIWEQYFDYFIGLFQGDLGNSLVTKKPVLEEFFTLFPATLELSLCAIIFAMVFGITAGVVAAVKRGTWFDQSVMGTALVGYSMPIFWWGLLLIILFSGILKWTPVSGRISLLYYFPSVTGFMLIDSLLSGQKGAFTSAVSHLILPTIVLGTIPLAVIARQTRSAMLEVLGEDYVRTARAKGLPPSRVVGIHALRNALIPVVTTIGLQVGVLLAGAILTETIFSWPGVGKWMVDSIFRRDYPSVQGGLLMIALIVMTVNLVVDLLYGLVNPKIRHTGG